jgi:hypothetical protein
MVERSVSGMYSVTAILTYYLSLSPGGNPATELTDSRVSGTEVPPDRLPALAFCLLFRFQGATALTHSLS